MILLQSKKPLLFYELHFFWKSSEFEFNQANGLLAGWYEIVAMIEFSTDEKFLDFQYAKLNSKRIKLIRNGQKAVVKKLQRPQY